MSFLLQSPAGRHEQWRLGLCMGELVGDAERTRIGRPADKPGRIARFPCAHAMLADARDDCLSEEFHPAR